MRTDVPLLTLLEKPVTAWTAPMSFDPHSFRAQTNSLLPFAPGVGQGLTSSGEASTQIAPGLGYRWAGQGLARAEASWPHSRCGSTSGAHTSNLWVDLKLW